MSTHAEAGERRGLCGHLQDEPVAMTALEPVRVWFAKANFRLREQPVIGPRHVEHDTDVWKKF